MILDDLWSVTYCKLSFAIPTYRLNMVIGRHLSESQEGSSFWAISISNRRDPPTKTWWKIYRISDDLMGIPNGTPGAYEFLVLVVTLSVLQLVLFLETAHNWNSLYHVQEQRWYINRSININHPIYINLYMHVYVTMSKCKNSLAQTIVSWHLLGFCQVLVAWVKIATETTQPHPRR